MDRDDLFQSLMDQDESALRDAWDDIHDELYKVQSDLSELSRLREKLEARKTIIQAILQLRELEAPTDERAASHANGRGGPRELVFTILNENPDRIWDGASMKRALKERGFDTSLSNARVLLQRLLHDGRARRVGRGEYQAAHGQSQGLLTAGGGNEK